MKMERSTFRVAKLRDFLAKSEDYPGADRNFDTETRIATFYGRRKYEYELKDGEDPDILYKRGFVEGKEIRTYEPW